VPVNSECNYFNDRTRKVRKTFPDFIYNLKEKFFSLNVLSIASLIVHVDIETLFGDE